MKYIIIAMFVTACSINQTLLKPSGTQRVGIVQEEYKRPDFFVSNDILPTDFGLTRKLFLEQKNFLKREPASINNPILFNSEILNSADNKQESKLSNRHLYFLTLFSQYQAMGNLLGIKSRITSCPSFHQVLLENKKEMEELSVSYKNLMTLNEWSVLTNDVQSLSFFPILAIPYSNEKDLYSVLVENNWQNISEYVMASAKNYYESSEIEIDQLCDKGVGPGYYIFENMVTYFKEENTFASTADALKSLVKIPVFANILLIDNLILKNNHNKNMLSLYDKKLLKRTNADWFSLFIDRLNDKRNKLAKAHNLKRTIVENEHVFEESFNDAKDSSRRIVRFLNR